MLTAEKDEELREMAKTDLDALQPIKEAMETKIKEEWDILRILKHHLFISIVDG